METSPSPRRRPLTRWARRLAVATVAFAGHAVCAAQQRAAPMLRTPLALLLITSLAAAGCGSSGSSTSGSSAPATTTGAVAASASTGSTASAAAAGATVGVAYDRTVGTTVLVDSNGRTLYVLTPETAGHLLCTSSSCLATWPALTLSSGQTAPRAAAGVTGRLGVLRRTDGTVQVTLGGLPLYTYVGDQAAGEATGEGLQTFGGTWQALSASGQPVEAQASAPKSAY